MKEVVLDRRQLECLASPIRNEVFAKLRLLGQASVKDLAQALRRKPQAIHYHVHQLVEAGLAMEVGRRPSARKPEAIYASVEGRISLPKHGERDLEALRSKAVVAGLRQTQREFTLATQQSDLRTRKFHVLKTHLRLSEDDVRQFLNLLEEALRFAEEHKNEECQALAWHSIVYPALRS